MQSPANTRLIEPGESTPRRPVSYGRISKPHLTKRGDFAIIHPDRSPRGWGAMQRGVAQPGSALEWGSSGPRFKSARPDLFSPRDTEAGSGAAFVSRGFFACAPRLFVPFGLSSCHLPDLLERAADPSSPRAASNGLQIQALPLGQQYAARVAQVLVRTGLPAMTRSSGAMNAADRPETSYPSRRRRSNAALENRSRGRGTRSTLAPVAGWITLNGYRYLPKRGSRCMRRVTRQFSSSGERSGWSRRSVRRTASRANW